MLERSLKGPAAPVGIRPAFPAPTPSRSRKTNRELPGQGLEQMYRNHIACRPSQDTSESGREAVNNYTQQQVQTETALGKSGDSVTLGRRSNVGEARGWQGHLGKGENGSVLGEGLESGVDWSVGDRSGFWPAENLTLALQHWAPVVLSRRPLILDLHFGTTASACVGR